MQTILETERLRLRTLTLEDASFILELLNSPGWLQFIGDKQVRTEEQAIRYLQEGPFKSYQQWGYGLWMVENKRDTQPIGLCGILKRDQLEAHDIGYALLPQYGGHGYAIEMVKAAYLYAKESLSLESILAITLPDNTRSIRVLEKVGFTFLKPFSFPASKEVLHLYGD